MGRAEKFGKLPEWDLGDLYPAPDAAEIDRDLERISGSAGEFEQQYKGELEALDGNELAEAISRYEAIEEGMGRLASYAGLLYATRTDDSEVGRFYQGIQEKLNGIGTHLLFFTLELNRMSEDAMAEKLESDRLPRFRPWLEDVRLFRDHQLSDEAEKLLHEKSVSGRAAWTRLFDETVAGLRFDVDGEELTEEETLNLLSSVDGEKRRSAAGALTRVFDENVRTFSLITNTLAKDKEIEDRWRHYATPQASRHLANQVEPEVVEALVESVREAYPRLSHRYYRIKARWFGQDSLDFWDRNAPLPEAGEEEIPWEQARHTVLSAYGAFSPKLAELARNFFDRPWIDAPVRQGKQGGAFSHPTVPSAHPYILLNYQGKTRDVMTLAHELGHGVHQLLAAPQGLLMADTPLTLAETASVFGEMLTFQAMLGAQQDDKTRRIMIASKVEDMLNTVVRQIAFHCFEERVHTERREGELTPARLGEIWLETQSESLGPAIELGEDYRNYWSYIPHFIHVPFYVYAYAFGDCLVNSLYASYLEAPEGFEEKYLEMLRAGGTKRHRELLEPFGLDAGDPDFWRRGLRVIEDLIDQLEVA